MAYTAPTAADLKARFPEFAAVSDTLINLILEEASARVGDTWLERDRKPATLYLAAHLLKSQGEPDRTNNVNGEMLPSGPVQVRQVGDVRVEFGSSGGGANVVYSGSADFERTAYGREYLRLLRMNFPAVAVV